ncbi:MAG: efflux RND transporter permease subunit [Flavobacteriales bacterium]|nr:MMPL family transporter [Flavobacteriaceae bacterium]MDO7582347.1 MMPL family transporter [Flavobacteriaceae bacterium]MDO7599979.1 MMPL family transporter [Flavobacteriaceae bacterium]MDO7602618.1 MMPL family transporter [Flavobacteriaceae bacterium]MDO7615533.1 MMPL family transporter [Flavobacteriaceae bacterium]
MKKKGNWNFWEGVARLILRNRFKLLLLLLAVTMFWVTQWKHMRFTFTEANLLPDKHAENIRYNEFLELFGEEGNVLVLAVQDPELFSEGRLEAWNQLSRKLGSFEEIDFTISIENLNVLSKNKQIKKLELVPFINQKPETEEDFSQLKQQLFKELPFFENLLFNKETQTVRTAVYMKTEIVNSAARKNFIYNTFIPLIKKFEEDNQLDVRVSGMPYIRTLNAQNIVDEIGVFVLGAMVVTSLIFFLFFRSLRATFISMIIVLIGVAWSLGTLGWMGYEITVLTALIPPLIIVIGIPNCIFLINKYQQEVSKHGNQVKSLQQVIVKIGNATLMTNLTTASGFATFILTDSKLLKEFGIIASINVIGIFILSLLLIPIIYSFLPLPNKKHLNHLKNKTIDRLVGWMEKNVRKRRINTYIISLVLLVASIIGIYQIRISGSILEDMPQKKEFFKDIMFFDNEFNGIVPLEILIDTKRKDGVLKLATLKRMDALGKSIESIPELSPPLSVVNAMKYAKQAYYNGNPNYYKLPTAQENNFILSYLETKNSNQNLMKNYVDSTGQYARLTTYMKDIRTERMEEIKSDLEKEIKKIFPEDRYSVQLTGKSLIFLKGTKYLVKNLVLSLSIAIFLIALFMAYLFRSYKMILISLIPNLLPLIVTAGMMGFLGIPIKPSTILVFSIAFGISVDDTIHFLAKYRQELIDSKWKIQRSVYAALKETGVSMFYTSIVLFFGFSVFMISEFGGTVALGGLVSATLLFAMLANLVLLPSLLISLERSVSNEEVMKEPTLQILEHQESKEDRNN